MLITTKTRLEYLRRELRAERISYGELAELQDLRDQIDPGDFELLEAAGVPEHGPTTTPIGDPLIAAAPGMLAALRLTLAEMQGPDKPYSSDSYLPPHLVRMIAETIAQAEGLANG